MLEWLPDLGGTSRCGNTVERPSYCFVRAKSRQVRLSCGCGPKGRPRIPEKGAHITAILGHYQRSAKARGIAFDLTSDDVRSLVTKDCTYCGAEPQVRYTHANLSGGFAWNGIDRMDSDTGYVAPNCVLCCPTCNFAKQEMTVEEFKAWLRRVVSHLGL